MLYPKLLAMPQSGLSLSNLPKTYITQKPSPTEFLKRALAPLIFELYSVVFNWSIILVKMPTSQMICVMEMDS